MKKGIGDRIKREYGDLTFCIIGAAMVVHNMLGPGFPEKFYQKALAIELTRRGVKFEREKLIKVLYGGVELGNFYLDFPGAKAHIATIIGSTQRSLSASSQGMETAGVITIS